MRRRALVVGFLLGLAISLAVAFLPTGEPLQPSKLQTLASPFEISGDAEFTGYPGNGTKINPYRIENLTINGGGGDYCILVEDTISYFVIKNVTVFNAKSGIILNNLSNGQINSCIAYNNYFEGIILIGSLNISLNHNNLFSNIAGISLVSTNKTLIFNNSASNNIRGNFGDGIRLHRGWFNEIFNNTINNNKEKGIYLIESHNNSICWNELLGNALPWFEDDCTNNTFRNNNAEWPEEPIWGFLIMPTIFSLMVIVLSYRQLIKYRQTI